VTEQRARVEEWRITTRIGPYVVRYWIESDPEHGGVSWATAVRQIESTEAARQGSSDLDPRRLAMLLLDAVVAANSVEVCDHQDGSGCAAHRDWP
jgi:hypothetical protein